MIALPVGLNATYGGGQGVFVSRAVNGTTSTGSSVGALPGGAATVQGGAPIQIVSGGGAGSTEGSIGASSSASSLPGAVMFVRGGAPMQVMSGTQSQASTSSDSLG